LIIAFLSLISLMPFLLSDYVSDFFFRYFAFFDFRRHFSYFSHTAFIDDLLIISLISFH